MGKIGGFILGSLGALKNVVIAGAGGLATWGALGGPNSLPQQLLSNLFGIQQTAGAEAGVMGSFQGIFKMVEMLSEVLKSWGIPADGMGNWARERMNDIPAGQDNDATAELKESLGELGNNALNAVPYVAAVREFQQGDIENGAQGIVADTAGLAGAWAGATMGTSVGASIGAGIGVWFGGVGAVPGAAIGGALGGIGGSIAGWFGGSGAANAAWEGISGLFQAPAPEPTRTAVLENMNGQFEDATNNRVATLAPQHRNVFGPQVDLAIG